MIASLPMYDFAHLRRDWDFFYHAIVSNFRNLSIDLAGSHTAQIPLTLARNETAMNWNREVFLSMSCGAPFRNLFSDHLYILGALDFGLIELSGCYQSLMLGFLKAQSVKIAVNDRGSQSGYHAPMLWLSQRGIEPEIVISGSHERSMDLVLEGSADMCGVDNVSYHFISQRRSKFNRLEIVGKTPPTPGLPLVTSQYKWTQPLKIAIDQALNQISDQFNSIYIKRRVDFSAQDYLKVKNYQPA